MNEQKLNKELAEWAGLSVHSFNDEHWIGLSPDNKVIHLEPFTQSLDTCFKWLVPKLTRYNLWCDTTWDEVKKIVVVGKVHFALAEVEEHTEVAEAETPALALCLAIEKLIDAEKVEA